ncbi:MAG: ATP-binding protein [Micrococcaceae bacterium]
MSTEKTRSWSLRGQLLSITTVLLIVSLLSTGIGTIFILKNTLISRVDSELTTSSRDLVNQIVQDSQTTRTDAAIRSLPSNYSILVYDGTNEYVRYYASSIDSSDHPDPKSLENKNLSNLRGQTFTVAGTGPESYGWRATVVQIPGSYNTYLVAQKLDGVQSLISQSAIAIFSVSSLVVLLAIVSAYLLITRSFRPLQRIEATAKEITNGDFSERLETDDETPQEIKQLEETLNTMLDKIETSFEARKNSEEKMRQFVSDASHELRTPLTTIIGYSEMFQKGWLTEDSQIDEAVTRVSSEATRMKALVEDLLDLARLDEKRTFNLTDVDLRELALEIVADSKASHPDRIVRVISLDDKAPEELVVQADNQRLRQVLLNLLTNAFRYTPEDTSVEIALGKDLSEENPQAILEIRDHGPGIATEEKEKIFNRFYRTDTSRVRTQGGNGLGLAIVSSIVQAHHGNVTLLDTPGGGATFRVSFPLETKSLETSSSEELVS